MDKILAWHNDPKKKAARLARVTAHEQADQIIQDYGYWEDGCSYHSGDHSLAETEDGIPIGIAYLVDRLFERLPVESARTWPRRFFEAIEPGMDLSLVWDKNQLYVFEQLRLLWKEEHRPKLDGIIGLWKCRADGNLPTREEGKSVGDQLRADRTYMADMAGMAYRADMSCMAYRADMLYMAYMADMAYMEDMADRADMAYMEDMADRANRADGADMADMAGMAVKQSEELLKILKAAPIVK